MPPTISALHIYPVKGLKGIDVEAALCTERGLAHDRRWMVVDATGRFISQRTVPRMATVWTAIEGDALELSAPDMPPLEVPLAPPPGMTLPVQVWSSHCEAQPAPPEADAWLSEYLGMRCRLVYMPDSTRRAANPKYAAEGQVVSFADGYALLAIGAASLDDLNARLAARGHPKIPMNRFRPSLVFSGGEPYAEDRWGTVRAGDAVLRAAKPCGRCQVTTTDQASGEVTGAEPLATLASYRESGEFGIMFGMNLVVERTGRVAVGDALRLDP